MSVARRNSRLSVMSFQLLMTRVETTAIESPRALQVTAQPELVRFVEEQQQ